MHPGKHAYSPDQPSFFFFNDTATTEIYTLSLHDALPISPARHPGLAPLATPSPAPDRAGDRTTVDLSRSEEHTSELQSRPHLVCRLLLEKKKRHLEGFDRRCESGGVESDESTAG